MARHVAMLRGINVGGRAKVGMAELRAVFGDLGYGDVQTYIQSGNVVFSTTDAASSLPPTIEGALHDAFALPVKVLLRTHAQLVSVLDRNPLAGTGRDATRLHVTFLAATPARAKAGAIDADAYAPDEFRVVGREVYVHAPGGYGRSKLSNTFFERALDVVATTRNLRTVAELARRSA